jgi:hypothetical protein
MADDFVGGSYTFAGDDIGGKVYARIKLVHGADGNNDGDVAWTNPLPITVVPLATNGMETFRSLDLDETEEQIKATGGTVYGMWITNRATTTRYVKFYDATAASVTVGTTTPMITVGVPGNSSDDIGGMFSGGGPGIKFSVAISVAATTGFADNDTGAPDANDCIINVFYK